MVRRCPKVSTTVSCLGSQSGASSLRRAGSSEASVRLLRVEHPNQQPHQLPRTRELSSVCSCCPNSLHRLATSPGATRRLSAPWWSWPTRPWSTARSWRWTRRAGRGGVGLTARKWPRAAGCGPSWWPPSSNWRSRRTGTCATHATLGCGATRRRVTWWACSDRRSTGARPSVERLRATTTRSDCTESLPKRITFTKNVLVT